MQAPDRPPLRLVEHALRLIGRTHKAGPDAARVAGDDLARWRALDRTHAEAEAVARTLWDASDGSALREAIAQPSGVAEARATRRRVVGMLGLGAVVTAVAGSARWYLAQPTASLALQAGHGQQLARTLPDGTAVDLGARSSATFTGYRDRREVRLEHGIARFQVRPDPGRPFTVHTPWGRVRVLGTTFSVSARDGRMRVAVAEGQVAVWGRSAAGEPQVVLHAGQSVQTDASPLGLGQVTPVRPADIGAWRQGWLVFDDVALAEAVERWNDYLRQPLRLGTGRGLGDLRLTGSFPLRDPEAFLAGLPGMLPVRVERDADGQVVIALRQR